MRVRMQLETRNLSLLLCVQALLYQNSFFHFCSTTYWRFSYIRNIIFISMESAASWVVSDLFSRKFIPPKTIIPNMEHIVAVISISSLYFFISFSLSLQYIFYIIFTFSSISLNSYILNTISNLFINQKRHSCCLIKKYYKNELSNMGSTAG